MNELLRMTQDEISQEYFDKFQDHFMERHEYTEEEWEDELNRLLKEGQDKMREHGYLLPVIGGSRGTS